MKFLLGVCMAFGLVSFANPTVLNVPGAVVHATNDQTTSKQKSTTEEGISEGDNSNLNIQIGDDGELTGGIAGTTDKKGTITTGNKILTTLRYILTFVIGGGSIIIAIFFVIHAVKLAKDGDNPQGKSASINGLILTAIAAALVGGTAIFMGLFFNLFK